MHLHLGRLLAGGDGTDVTFEVAGETVAAHSYILAARSPVFMAQLFGPMKEKSMACVRIEDMEARVFRALLHFVYSDSLPEIEHDDDNNYDEEEDVDDKIAVVQHLLVAADRYGLDRLKLLSEHKLCSCIDTSNVGTVLALAEQHGCNGLKKACFKFLMLGSNLKEAVATDGFQHLGDRCPSILRELLAL
ncbi:unnamed protein product [Miscanthus lutarioriparius]|uniref:BTB domain-containing protein n=1 Tax=Miscanthus lutarioriparius TaxID=422564 RepID=A0A811SKQ2_9POAL|nr:unnamed protein product [Miscanthus lutarioriparius]